MPQDSHARIVCSSPRAVFDETQKVGSSSVKQPALTCRSWLVSDASTGKPLLWHLPLDRLQPASITKVVTAMVVLDYIDAQAKAAAKGPKVPKSSKSTTRRSRKAALLETRCQVSDYGASFAAWVPHFGWNQGTNAQLKAKEVYSVRELLYAMMLPSGNDAAVTLARCFGPLVSRKCPTADMGVDAEDEEGCERASVALFVEQMNKTAATLGCHDTFFKSCHGMSDDENLSCAADIATFSIAAMKNPLFAKVVRSIKYKCDARAELGRDKGKIWTNTNVLLRSALAHRYDGVKTGWVPRAHGCDKQQREWGTLVTRVSRNTPDLPPDDVRASGGGRGLPMRAGMKLMVVVVGSASQQDRFSDTQALVSYAWRCLESSASAQSALLSTTNGPNAHPTSTSLRGVLRAAKALSAAPPRHATAGLADTHFKGDRQTPIKRPWPSSPCVSNSSSTASLSSLLSGAPPPAATRPAAPNGSMSRAIKPKDRGPGSGRRGGARASQHEGDMLRPPASRTSSEAVLSARFRGAAARSGLGHGVGAAKSEHVQSEQNKGVSRDCNDLASSIENRRLNAGNPRPPSSCARTGHVVTRPWAAAALASMTMTSGAVSKTPGVGVENNDREMRQIGGCSAEGPCLRAMRGADPQSDTESDGECDSDEGGEGDAAIRSLAGSAAGQRKGPGLAGLAGCPGSSSTCAFPPVDGAADTAMLEALVGKGGGICTPPTPASPQTASLNDSAPSPFARATPPPSPSSPRFSIIRSPALSSACVTPTNLHMPTARITSPALSSGTGGLTKGAAYGACVSVLGSHDRAPPFGRYAPMPYREPLVCNAH